MKKAEIQLLWSGLFEQYAVLLGAGVNPEEATALLCQDGQEPAELLRELLRAQQQGAGFAEALEGCGAFPGYTARVIRMGEDTGHLEQSCRSLSEYYGRRAMLERRLMASLRYPALLLLAMCAVLGVLVFAVLPIFHRVYESMAGDMLSSGYGFVVLGGILGRAALLISLLFCALALLVSGRVRREGVEALNSLGRRVGVVGKALRLLDAGRLADMLSTMLYSGMTASDALLRSRDALAGGTLDEELGQCIRTVEEGENLAHALRLSGVYPPVTARLLVAEAESGRLDRGLASAAESCSREGVERLCDLIDAVEPSLSLFLTVTVGLSLLSAMLPLFGILSAIG